jgi:hypothetical protein
MNSKRVLTWVNVLSASGVIIAIGEIAAGGIMVHPPSSGIGPALGCAHVSDAGSRVPSDGVAGHVSAGPPFFGLGLQFLDDCGDLGDVLGCNCSVRRTLQMASELQFLLLSMLAVPSAVLSVAIVEIWGPFSWVSRIITNLSEEDSESSWWGRGDVFGAGFFEEELAFQLEWTVDRWVDMKVTITPGLDSNIVESNLRDRGRVVDAL